MEEFGEARLAGLLAEHAGGTSTDVEHAVLEALNAFGEGVPPFDDVTMVVLKHMTR